MTDDILKVIMVLIHNVNFNAHFIIPEGRVVVVHRTIKILVQVQYSYKVLVYLVQIALVQFEGKYSCTMTLIMI